MLPPECTNLAPQRGAYGEERVMNGLACTRVAGSAALRVGLLAAMLMLAAGTSQADRDGGRGSGQGQRTHGRGGDRGNNGGGGRSYNGGGGRSYNGGGGRTYGGGGGSGYTGGGGRTYGGGGGSAYNGGGGRRYKDGGGSIFSGGGGRSYGGGGGRTYIGGGGRSYGGGSRIYIGGGGPVYGGGSGCYGGVPYYSGVRYYTPYPYPYRYVRPRTVISFGIGLGLPYYCPPTYRSYVEPYPVEVESSSSIDVENEPPAGCYYYDQFCDRQFSNLDDYTAHVDSQNHAKTIAIIRRDSGERLRTLEFVDGYWSVMR
jgi:hypothetical protein